MRSPEEELMPTRLMHMIHNKIREECYLLQECQTSFAERLSFKYDTKIDLHNVKLLQLK